MFKSESNILPGEENLASDAEAKPESEIKSVSGINVVKKNESLKEATVLIPSHEVERTSFGCEIVKVPPQELAKWVGDIMLLETVANAFKNLPEDAQFKMAEMSLGNNAGAIKMLKELQTVPTNGDIHTRLTEHLEKYFVGFRSKDVLMEEAEVGKLDPSKIEGLQQRYEEAIAGKKFLVPGEGNEMDFGRFMDEFSKVLVSVGESPEEAHNNTSKLRIHETEHRLFQIDGLKEIGREDLLPFFSINIMTPEDSYVTFQSNSSRVDIAFASGEISNEDMAIYLNKANRAPTESSIYDQVQMDS
jgi:hypothetical protein